MKSGLDLAMSRTLRAATVHAAILWCSVGAALTGCSFATDLDTGGIESKRCSETRPCPSGAACGVNGYCYALDAGSDLSGVDTHGVDTAGLDTVGMDTEGMDTLATDTAGNDTSGTDTQSNDTAVADTATADTTTADTAVADTVTTDTAGGCTNGLFDCNGSCVNVQTSNQHCGDCNAPCSANQTCTNGICTGCPGTETLCGGTCVDTTTDPAHCGGCNQVCAGGDGVCSASECHCQTNSGPLCYASAPSVQSATCDKRNCLLVCDTGRANCNNNAADGCEANSPCPP